jgi:NTE family protein
MNNIVLFFLITFFVLQLQAQEIEENVRPKVGLVLSGGGAKGFAHIGVLKVIEETGVKIDYIAGTSMGAVVGGLYAANYSAKEIDSIINSLDFMRLLQDVVPRSQSSFFEKKYGEKYLISFPVTKKGRITLPAGITSGQSIYNELNALFEHVDTITQFEKLPIPFFCMTTDIESGEAVVLDSGHLSEAIRASASFPTLLEPIEIRDRTFIDGGIANNFPVDAMRARGATIIIGVDVQGKLESKEDINSVVDILNQIVNFKMYAKDEEKISELTVHIKPNTEDFSVTSFDKSVEIITEGQSAADVHREVLESISELQKKYDVKEINPVKKEKLKRKITSIRINPLQHFSGAYIRGKMNLEFGDSLSYSELNKKIGRLSSGNDFEMIKYSFKEINAVANELTLDIKENTNLSSVKVGLHYDPLYKSSLLLNFTTKHMLIKNDILSTDFVLGDNVRVNLNYFVDNGIYTSYGLSSRFNSLKANVKFNGVNVNEINKQYIDFTSMVYIQTTYNRKFAVGLGFEHKWLDVSTKAFIIEKGSKKYYFDKSNYFNSLVYLKLDTYDKKAFPKNGVLVDGEAKYYMTSSNYNDNFSSFCQAKLRLAAVKTLVDKFTFHITLEGGTTFDTNTSGQFQYALGGFGENMINNHIPFYGYSFEDNENHSYLKGVVEVRYEVYKKHTVALITNYGKTDLDIFNGGQVFQDVLSGYALIYGYESVLGPLKIVRDWTPDINKSNWYLSIGFWF